MDEITLKVTEDGVEIHEPYCTIDVATKEEFDYIKSAIAKQKAYEPETDKLIVGVGRCKCKVEFLDKDTRYCGNCGQKIKW